MAISHKDHHHPNTPAARAGCRNLMKAGGPPLTMDDDVRPAKLSVVPRRRGDGGVVNGLQATTPKPVSGSLKRPGTHLRTIADLPDVPQMLAYAVRLAWAADLEVVAGYPFNDTESNIVIKGPAAHITCIWRSSQPNGIYAMRIRPVNSSKGAGEATSAQQAVDIARGVEPIPGK